MEGMLEPEEVEASLGMAEVRQTFRASRIGTIAGSHVVQGKITRNASVRLVREGTIVYDGALASLKRFKDDVREVEEGFECGIVLENFQDVKEGDVLEAYETRKVAQRARISGSGHRVPFLVALTIHLRFPDNGSLKGKRKELLSVRVGAEPQVRRVGRRGRRSGQMAARHARRRARVAHGVRCGARRRRHRAVSRCPVPGGRARGAPARVVSGPRGLS